MTIAKINWDNYVNYHISKEDYIIFEEFEKLFPDVIFDNWNDYYEYFDDLNLENLIWTYFRFNICDFDDNIDNIEVDLKRKGVYLEYYNEFSLEEINKIKEKLSKYNWIILNYNAFLKELDND